MAISNSASPDIIWGLGGPEEDHQLHHSSWTGSVGEREEEEEEEEEEELLLCEMAMWSPSQTGGFSLCTLVSSHTKTRMQKSRTWTLCTPWFYELNFTGFVTFSYHFMFDVCFDYN